MDRGATAYLILHYLILLMLIFGIVVILEGFVATIPLAVGIVIAVIVGLAYPHAMVAAGIAPEQWES